MTANVCLYPAREDSETGELPEGFDEWRAGDFCSHAICAEVALVARTYRGAKEITRQERAEIAADRELVRDEYHGNQP